MSSVGGTGTLGQTTRETIMRISSGLLRSTIAVALVAGTAVVALAADITGAGATFPFPIYSKWAAAYSRWEPHPRCGIT